jgi:HSP20 family protein
MKRQPFEPFFRGGFFNTSPFALMRQFTEEMDRAFGPIKAGAGFGDVWSPAIEVKEKDGKLFVTADLPGLKKEDVKVRIDGDVLVLEGERKFEKEEKREGYYHSERSYGNFYRTIALPAGVKPEEAAAKFENGVLEVTVPIPAAKKKAQEVPIKEISKAEAKVA